MKTLVWSLTFGGLLISSAQAFDYVDSRGYRHWNHNKTAPKKEVVQNPGKPTVEIVEDKVKFHPLDEAHAEESGS